MKYLVAFLRYIKGYVVFKAEKGFIERFMNLCTKNRIHLWNISVENGVLTACVSVHNFKRIRTSAKKAGVKIKIISKFGLVFQYRRYNKRVGIAIGLVIFALFHLVMSQFVWCIDVSGNNLISEEEITECAESTGLTYGTYKKNFDEIKAARQIAASYDGAVPWLAINIKGSMAIIELREKNEVIDRTEDNSPCNLIADFDGIILSVETFHGDAEVTVGNAVKKGDMLINGVIVNEDLSTTYYNAKGRITALHSKTVSITEKKSYSQSAAVTSDVYYSVGLFGIDIPLGKHKNTEDSIVMSDKRNLQINGYKLPFYIKKNTVIELADSKDVHTEEYMYQSEKINFKNYSGSKNTTVVSKNEKLSVKNNAYIFTGDYTVIDFIGEKKPILSDNLK